MATIDFDWTVGSEIESSFDGQFIYGEKDSWEEPLHFNFAYLPGNLGINNKSDSYSVSLASQMNCSSKDDSISLLLVECESTAAEQFNS